MQCESRSILIYSPDTDVYNIGLSFINQHLTATYVIQLNLPHSDESKYINLNNFHTALLQDMDLCNLQQDVLCKTLQTLFICTGCDYVSYFKGIGKATVLNNFFQHASFICGQDMPGSLHNTIQNDCMKGFMAFIRLIGTCYFKKHLPAFQSAKEGHTTPVHLYNSLETSLQVEERHRIWLQRIREIVSNRIFTEEDRVPTFTALWRHWLRSCWVSQLWQHSNHPDIYLTLPAPEQSGWVIQDGQYLINWESPEVEKKIKSNIDFLLKGCNCKKQCKTFNCGCRKKSRYCGPGCLCQGCTNVKHNSVPDDNSDSSSSDEGDSATSSSENDEELEEEIITDDNFHLCSYDII